MNSSRLFFAALMMVSLSACEAIELINSVGSILKPMTESSQNQNSGTTQATASVQQTSNAAPQPSESAIELVLAHDPVPVSTDWNLARQPGTTLSVSSTLNETYAKERLLDGKLTTSWFAGDHDTPGKGRLPTLEISFQQPVGVLSVNLRGDRERNAGLAIQELSLLITSSQGILLNETVQVPANSQDVNLVLRKPVDRASSLRLTVTRSQGTPGLAEIEVLGRR